MHKEQGLRYGEYELRVARLAALARKRPLKKEEMEQLQLNLACMRMLCDTPYILDQDCRISPKLQELVGQSLGDYRLDEIITMGNSGMVFRGTDTKRDRMVAAAATAVGINMTFLLPYSMLKRGWDEQFCGLVKFDLATGLFVPFLLATSCVVIASATSRP